MCPIFFSIRKHVDTMALTWNQLTQTSLSEDWVAMPKKKSNDDIVFHFLPFLHGLQQS